MSTAGLVAFNLLLNGVCAFAIAWGIAWLAMRVFRAGPGRAHIALLALPFVKLAVDVGRGVPEQSFLWLRASGVPQDMGSFQLGLGLRWVVPQVRLALGAHSAGQQYTQSAPDLLAALLTRKVGAWLPVAIAGLLLVVGAARLVARALAWRRAGRERRALSRGATLTGKRRVGWRWVSIFVTDEVAGSPFTGGILAPYVCFPRPIWDALRPEERRAALAHELGHVAEHHVLVLTLAGVVRDVFWFVPFIGAAERRLREACELSADEQALHRSTAAVLASALLRARESMAVVLAGNERAATLAAGEVSLRVRIERLLDAPPHPRLGFQHPVLRALLTAWVTSVVLVTLAFGNH